jgi:hypothetical protein
VKGEIVRMLGTYMEMVVDEAGSTRMIVCFRLCRLDPEPDVDIEAYRVEYQGGQQTYTDLQDALTTFRILTEQDRNTKDRMHCFRLAERVKRGCCINCGTSESVIRALCVECRKLPRFQAVLEGE